MATARNDTWESYAAGADLSTKQFYIMKFTGARTVGVAGAGERSVGVLQNEPKSGEAASVAVLGLTKVWANGNSVNIAAGDPVKSDGSGMAVKAATDKDKAIGVAVDACTADAVIIGIKLLPMDIAV